MIMAQKSVCDHVQVAGEEARRRIQLLDQEIGSCEAMLETHNS